MVMDYINVHEDVYNYFYWLNFIPAGGIFCYTIRYVDINCISNVLTQSTFDYIMIKSAFKLLEDCRFYFVTCLFGGMLLTLEGHKGKKKFIWFLVAVYFFQLFFLCLSFEQLLIALSMRMLFFGIFPLKHRDTKHNMNKVFLVSCFYFIDLIMNYRLFLELHFFSVDYVKLAFYFYTILILGYILFYKKISYFASAYAIVNFIGILCIAIYNFCKKTVFNYLDAYCLKMAIVLSIALIALSHICSRSKMVKIFPPEKQSLYDFMYFSLANIIRKETFDMNVIQIKLESILPQVSNKDTKVFMRIQDFKLISAVHILNELYRKTNEPLDITSTLVASELDQSKLTLYDALNKTKKHYDELDQAIEEAIESVIDVNNDVVSDIIQAIGFRSIGLGYIFSKNTYSSEKNMTMASKLEYEINNKKIGNIITVINPNVNADEE